MRHAWERNAYRVLVGELEGMRPLGRTLCRLEDNNIFDVKERGLGVCVMPVHPFVCSHGTTRLALNGFS
jgi:hypothetical protein